MNGYNDNSTDLMMTNDNGAAEITEMSQTMHNTVESMIQMDNTQDNKYDNNNHEESNNTMTNRNTNDKPTHNSHYMNSVEIPDGQLGDIDKDNNVLHNNSQTANTSISGAHAPTDDLYQDTTEYNQICTHDSEPDTPRHDKVDGKCDGITDQNCDTYLGCDFPFLDSLDMDLHDQFDDINMDLVNEWNDDNIEHQDATQDLRIQ